MNGARVNVVTAEVARALAALRSGAPMPEAWLYWRAAVDLILAGVAEEELEPLRSTFFFSMWDSWGQDAALKRSATSGSRGRRGRRETPRRRMSDEFGRR